SSTGAVTLDQVRALQHPNASNPNELINLTNDTVILTATATDKDGDQNSASLNIGNRIGFLDDAPTISSNPGVLGTVQVDETVLQSNATVSATDVDFVTNVFTPNYRADGAATTNPLVYSLQIASDGVNSGLVDTATGQAILLYKVGNDVVGHVGNSSGAEAFRMSLTGDAMTLTQSRAVVHPTTGASHNEPVGLVNGALFVRAVATDKDGDNVQTQVDVGSRFTFLDDGPAFISASPAPTVDEADLPLGSSPNAPALTVNGSLNVNFGMDTGAATSRDVQFTTATQTKLEAWADSNSNPNLTVSISPDGHTLTALNNGNPAFTVTLAVAANGAVTYEFTLQGPLTHFNVSDLTLPFNDLQIIDGDGDTTKGNFSVIVLDDEPPVLVHKVLIVNEDLTNDGGFGHGAPDNNTFNTNADATGGNTAINGGANAPQHGSAVVNPNGTITYTPNANYSGQDTFTYTTNTDQGPKTYTVDVTVRPITNDVPQIPHDGETNATHPHFVYTLEDTDVLLGLKAPVITDPTDQNGATADDHPERLGVITLTLSGAGAVTGTELLNGATALIPTVANGSVFTVVIVDSSGSTTPSTSYHHAGVPSGAANINYLTVAQYEAITVSPALNRHENFNVNVSVTEYEVNDSRVVVSTPDNGTNGRPNTETIFVSVEAVTDDAQLIFNTTAPLPTNVDAVTYGGAGGNTAATVTIKEDRNFNVKDILIAQFADLDDTEVRSITITNTTGQNIVVNESTVLIGASVTINDMAGGDGQTGGIGSFPDIRIRAVNNFSGDLNNIILTINAQDYDADGYYYDHDNNSGTPLVFAPANPATLGVPEANTHNNTVVLNLRVTPVAGDVTARNVSTAEDTAVAFLQDVRVTDTRAGDERINSVSFVVPDNWKVIAPTGLTPPLDTGWSVIGDGLGDGIGSDTYTINFDASLTEAQREAVLDAFMIQPPAHSSKDLLPADLQVVITSTDTNTVNSTSVSDTATKTIGIGITVTPAAEVFVLTGSDPIKSSDWSTTNTDGSAANANEDGNGTPDLTMNPDHDYHPSNAPFTFVDDRSVAGYNPDTVYPGNGGQSYNQFIAANHFAVEDEPFYINQDGFFLEAGWFNEDGVDVTPDANGHKEETYATLSAYLDDKTTAVAGGTFEYFDGAAWVAPLTIAGVSVPVIPMEFLDQVRFTPPANFSGAEIAIKVQAVTKDYDEDAPFTAVTAVTGVAWLTSIFVLPKADSVTIGVNPREVMDEDTTRALTIRMKSTDPTEVFDADIKGIIAGAKIEFAGYVYDTAADSSTWVNGADRLVFDSGTGKYTLQLHNLPTGTINPIYTPPLHSNDKNVLLNVDVVSKAEYNGFVTISPVQTLPIAISVLGVPDAPILTTATGLEWIENNIDEHNGNGTSNDVLSINDAPNLIALSIFIPGGVTGGELAQSPSDTSETITLRITDLPVGFELTDANGNPLNTLAGGSGDARVWVLTPAQIATTQIKTPVNFSGTENFTVQPVVTENDGRATKFALQTVEFKITPSPEATLNLSSNVWEDEIGGNIGRIDLSTVIQNGDNVNDEIYEVRILAADVTARNLILYSDAAGTTPLDANGDGYYYIAQANLNSVYVRSPANYSGDINLNMDYIVRDTSSDTTLGPIYTGPTTAGLAVPSWGVAGGFNTISHTLHFRPVTDVVDMAFESFANTGGTVGIDIHAGHPQYTLAGTGTVTVNLDITKAIDVSSHEALNTSVSNERDYDYAGGAGEHITRIVIDGVPDGVTVDGATFLGGGQWQITAADGFTGQIDKAVTFNVNRAINDVDGRDIYMTVYTQDKDAAITTDTVIVNIKTTFTGGTPVILPTLDLSPLYPTVLEDDYNDPDTDGAGFALSKAVQLESVTIPTGGSIPASYDLTVTIRTYPGDDTTFSGAGISGPITVIENAGTPQEQVVTLWVVTTTVTDANAQSTLQGILDDIRVITAEHGNINNLNRTVPIDVSAVFNSSGVARGDRVGGATDYDNTNPTDVAGADDAAGIVTITPVTDQATLTITQTAATNEGGTIPISITVSNEADESGDWDIVDGTVYFQLSAGTSAVIAGELQYTDGTPLSTVTDPAGLPSGTYYYITGATPDTSVNLQYVISQAGMTKYESGSFNLKAWTINQENGSTLQLLSDGTTTLTVNKVNTPPHITVMATGSENDGTPSTEGHIQLTINEIRMPADVGEVLSSAFIEGVPSGFIVYAGADEASAEATNLANNAGDGVWSLPVSGGDLPAYISIKPPAYWSGTVTSLSGLKLVLVSGESGLSPDATGFGFDLEVAPDADGIFALAPTYSFSNVGKPVSLNLNIGMEDPALIVVGAPDGNRELTRLIFTGIQDGANAVFLANNAMINPSRITYNAGTHTIEGLTQSELDTLQILHTPTSGLDPITVNAQTYEVDVDTGAIIDTSGLFGVQNFNLNVIGTTAIITDTSSGSPATPTAGNDYLTGSSSNDYINADAGNDIIFGADGEDSLVGGLGNDELHGGNDKDILLGGAGNDYLYGDAANDILHGGTGNDILTGGAGADTFVWGTGDNDNSIDVITDFDTGDMVDVSGLLDQLGWDNTMPTLSNFVTTHGTNTFDVHTADLSQTVHITVTGQTFTDLADLMAKTNLKID
ncbi:MAG: cadherin-like domain-containing protein, partial [Acinetobacter junii]|nr:cadherin-like domain-containing protein [Acinetobacter junii]